MKWPSNPPMSAEKAAPTIFFVYGIDTFSQLTIIECEINIILLILN